MLCDVAAFGSDIITSPIGRSYKLFKYPKVTFETALLTCRSMNGILPEVVSKVERDWLSKRLVTPIWLGATSTISSYSFRWISDSEIVDLNMFDFDTNPLNRECDQGLLLNENGRVSRDCLDESYGTMCELAPSGELDDVDEPVNEPMSQSLNSVTAAHARNNLTTPVSSADELFSFTKDYSIPRYIYDRSVMLSKPPNRGDLNDVLYYYFDQLQKRTFEKFDDQLKHFKKAISDELRQ